MIEERSGVFLRQVSGPFSRKHGELNPWLFSCSCLEQKSSIAQGGGGESSRFPEASPPHPLWRVEGDECNDFGSKPNQGCTGAKVTSAQSLGE